MKLPYEEFDLSGVKTYPLRSRQSKVSLAQFATPYKKGAGVQGLVTSLPGLLAAQDFKAVVTALITARNAGKAIVWGLGAHVLTMASDQGLIDSGLKLRTMRLPDRFQDHDNPDRQYAEAGLDADAIVETVLKALRHNSAGMVEGARA